MASGLTYGHFTSTGVQDCDNVISIDELGITDDDVEQARDGNAKKVARAVVERAFKSWNDDGMKEGWLEQNGPIEDLEGLDPDRCYEAWSDGWKSCAVRHAKEEIESRWEQKLMDTVLFYVMVPTAAPDLMKRKLWAPLDFEYEHVLEHYESIDDALATLARLPIGRLWEGDANGPQTELGVALPHRDTLQKWDFEYIAIPKPTTPALPGQGWLTYSRLAKFKDLRVAARRRGDLDPSKGLARRRNPAPSEGEHKAVEKFLEFHRKDPKELVTDMDFTWPRQIRCMGPATWVTYRSTKVIPDTMEDPGRKGVDYIHEHDAGVELYVPIGTTSATGKLTDVPEFVRDCEALTLLGVCTGFGFKDATGKEGEAQGKKPYPEIYCTPDGRALVVIQDKKQILAMMWGGTLGVEGRGIVG